MTNRIETIIRNVDTLWRADLFTAWLIKNGYCAQRVQISAKKHRFEIGATNEETKQIDGYLKALRRAKK